MLPKTLVTITGLLLAGTGLAQEFTLVGGWLRLTPGRETLGDCVADGYSSDFIHHFDGGNQLPPEKWRTGYVLAPHGVATNAAGDLFIAEFNSYGRVHKFAHR